MNFTELARKLKLTPRELHEVLPLMGFDIGSRAIKVDKRIAERIIEKWSLFRYEYLKNKEAERLEEEAKVKAERGKEKIQIPSVITVRLLAEKLRIPVTTLLFELMKNGIVLAMNERIDFETAIIVANDLGFQIEEAPVEDEVGESKESRNIEQILEERLKDQTEEGTITRPPVIVVMGHVDHGKTKILDAIRKTHVMETESGGITQHIGAYQVERNGKPFTFIDTPGHEAFTTMRSRGARIADIAILVVAADDSVKPQTLEAIKIIQGSHLPMIVALNKIDKTEANIERVKKDLATHNILAEDWGGDILMIPVSAKEGTGIEELLDALVLLTEMNEGKFRSRLNTDAVGTIIESHVDKGEGPIATLLVQLGTLSLGDCLGVQGFLYGKVRAMKDYRGEIITMATPGMPVRVLGFKLAPAVGEIVEAAKNVDGLLKMEKSQMTATVATTSFMGRVGEEDDKGQKTYPLILKTDVVGSLEAIVLSLEKLSTSEVPIRIVGKGLGAITEGEVLKAEATGAIICGFHVKPTQQALELAKEKDVTLRLYKVIYDMLEEVKTDIETKLSPEEVILELGKIQVLQIFRKEKESMIIGGKVLEGKVTKGAKARVKRAGTLIGEGEVTELQSGKQSVPEVVLGSECGIFFSGAIEIEEHDVLEVFQKEERKKTL